MDKKTENKFNMYKVVQNWIADNLTKLEGLPGFTDTFNEWSAMLESIAVLDKNKTMVTTGITIAKAESRQQLQQLMIEMARIVKVYATFNNDQVLLNDIDFTDSQLGRSSEQLLLVRSQKMIDHAEAIQVKAEPYGLTTERVEVLKTAHALFSEKQTTVRNAIVNRKDSGEQLEAQMDEADDLLKSKIDLLMDLSQNTYPELHNQYKASRVIIDR